MSTSSISDKNAQVFAFLSLLFGAMLALLLVTTLANLKFDKDRIGMFVEMNLLGSIFGMASLLLFIIGISVRLPKRKQSEHPRPHIVPLHYFLIPTGFAIIHAVCAFTFLVRAIDQLSWHTFLLFLPCLVPIPLCWWRICLTLAARSVRLELLKLAHLGETLSASLWISAGTETLVPVKIQCRVALHWISSSTSALGPPRWQAEIGARARDNCLDHGAEPYREHAPDPSKGVVGPADKPREFFFLLDLPREIPKTVLFPNPMYTWRVVVRLRRYGFTHSIPIVVDVNGPAEMEQESVEPLAKHIQDAISSQKNRQDANSPRRISEQFHVNP